MLFSAVIPQDLSVAASPVFAGLNLSGLSASQAVLTDASKNLSSADYLNQAVKTTSSPIFAGLTYSFGQGFLIRQDYSQFAVQGQTSATDMAFRLFSKDGDGTDNLALMIFGTGLPEDWTVFQILRFGYFKTYYALYADASSAGLQLPLYVYTDTTHSTQLRLLTDGKITMGYELSVAGGIKINSDTTKFYCGAGNDLQLYHDGTNSYLYNDTGLLKIQDAGSGISIGTAITEAIGFYGVTPVAQQANIVVADGTLADVTTKFNILLGYFQTFGLMAEPV